MVTVGIGVGRRTNNQIDLPYIGTAEDIGVDYFAEEARINYLRKFLQGDDGVAQRPQKAAHRIAWANVLVAPYVSCVGILP